MAINSIGFNNSLFGQAVVNLNNQLTTLSTQLATGEKSTTYSGMGSGESFAIAARSQGIAAVRINCTVGSSSRRRLSMTRGICG